MIFNGGMTIWIFAILLMTAVALAGWRQGAIRAAISFVGILFAWLLAVPVGRLVHPLLPHLGASNPVMAWALAPMVGFVLVSIAFKLAARPVHNRVEHFYKYSAGDLRLALWTRMNSRLGICVGLLNGTLYFILISFLIFNLTYLTTQVGRDSKQSTVVRLVNQLGWDMQASGVSRMASAVGSVRPEFYQYADLAGFLVQQKDALRIGQRLSEYPALTSLWERDDMKPLVQDATLTNALVSGATLGEILNNPNVQAFLANKDETKMVVGILQTNLADLMSYLDTGKSAKFGSEKIIGYWEFNPAVTMAWMRQNNPKISASEMRAIRSLWTQAYAETSLLVAGDSQLFAKKLPKFLAQQSPNQPPFQAENWKGDWAANGNNKYDLHLALNGEDKFLNATAEELRLTVKDGKRLLIFDRAD